MYVGLTISGIRCIIYRLNVRKCLLMKYAHYYKTIKMVNAFSIPNRQEIVFTSILLALFDLLICREAKSEFHQNI